MIDPTTTEVAHVPPELPASSATAAAPEAFAEPPREPETRRGPEPKAGPESERQPEPQRQPERQSEPKPETEAEPERRQRVWVTGGAGFVGRSLVRTLVARGYDVTAAVRDPRRATFLTDYGATVVEDDLSDVRRMTESLREMDALIHAAGQYKIGITRGERGAMWDANIGTTTRVLDAAEAAGTKRIVYVSTLNVLGNTRGLVVDESYRRNLREGFLSWYDQTKYGAHEVVEQRMHAGAPVVIVMPTQVYGPGDHSGVGEQLTLAYRGKLPYLALDDLGVSLVHADDLASGIVGALERGRVGQSYILAGPSVRLRDAVALAARIGGKRPPRLRVPTRLLRLMRPFGRLVNQRNLGEVISAASGVTYWGSSAKARAELGFVPRSVEDGLRDTFAMPPDLV